MQSVGLPPTGKLSESLARLSTELTPDLLHRMLFEAEAEAAAQRRVELLQMLCMPSKGIGALKINKLQLDQALGTSAIIKQALVVCGFVTDGSLAADERCRLYSSLWFHISDGAWAISRGFVDSRLRAFVRDGIERILCTAWARLPADSTLAAAFKQARSLLLQQINMERETGTAFFTLLTAVDETGCPSAMESPVAGTPISMPMFSDAFEAMMHDRTDIETPPGILVWRIYCLARLSDGFPVGCPNAVSALTSVQVTKPWTGVPSTTTKYASLQQMNPTHRIGSPRSVPSRHRFGSSRGSLPQESWRTSECRGVAVRTTAKLHELRLEALRNLGNGGGASLRSGLSSGREGLWEALPLWQRVRSACGGDLIGQDAGRGAWSLGESRIMALTDDEEDTAMWPHFDRLATDVHGHRHRLRPRILPWFASLQAALDREPHGNASLSRWLLMAMAHPTKSRFAGDLPDYRARVLIGAQPSSVSFSNPASASSSTSPLSSAQVLGDLSPLLELGGTPLVTLISATWYRFHLERFLASQTPWEAALAQQPVLNQQSPTAVAFIDEGDRMGLVGERHAPEAGFDQTATWSTMTEAFWPLVATDLQYATYIACFPPPPHHRISLNSGACSTDLGTAVRRPSALCHGADPDEIAIAASQSERKWWEAVDEEADSRRRAQVATLWDVSDPFTPQARWLASGFVPLRAGIPHEPSDVWRNPGRAGGLGARGRMSCLRWCVETTTAATACIAAEASVTAELGLSPKLLPESLATASPWAFALAQASYERIVVACRHTTSAGFLTQSAADVVDAMLGDQMSALIHDAAASSASIGDAASASVESAAASTAVPLTAAADAGVMGSSLAPGAITRPGFVRDVVGLMRGLPDLKGTAWRQPGSQDLPSDAEVASWAQQVMGHRGYIGWDTLLALAAWDEAEEPYPTNCCALIDMEPVHPLETPSSSVDDASKGHGDDIEGTSAMQVPSAPTPVQLQHRPDSDWCRPARLVALLMVLSQAVPASPAACLGNWVLAAKQAFAVALRRYTGMLDHLKAGGTKNQRQMLMRSALLWSLFSARRKAASSRISLAALVTACAPGAVVQFALHTGVEFHHRFERVSDSRWALQHTAPAVAMFARALHLLGGGMADAIAAASVLAGL